MKLNSSLSAYQPNQLLRFPATLRLSVIQFCAVTGLHDLASECLYVIGIEQDLKSRMLVAACSKGFVTVSIDLDILDLFSVNEIPNTGLLTHLTNPLHEWNLICNGIFF